MRQSRREDRLNILRVTLVQRYIIKELAQGFVLCFVSLLTLILMGRGLQMRNLFLGLDLSALDAAMLFFYMIPMFMLIVVPFSCMLTVFLSFLRMSTDRELVALRAGGVSLYQLLPAPLIFCTLCAVMTLFVSLYGVSWGMDNFRATIVDIANNRARIVVQPGVFNQDIFGLTLFARQVDPDTQEMRSVIFEDRTQDKKNRLTILAETGTIKAEPSTGSLLFTLHNGHIYRADGEQFGILGFDTYEIRLDLSKVFSGADIGEIRPKEMSWDQLRQAYREPDVSSPRFQLKVAVELQKRWALPVSCIVLGLFAMPLACMFEGVRRQMGVVLSLVTFLIYYSVFSLGISIGESGKVAPAFGLWVPNALFAVLGILGLYLTVREQVPTVQSILLRIPYLRRREELRVQQGDGQ
ncbi:putative Permease [uncultured delta proteobacterium]|uniref:Putative Permease n=1 Tax=uncultured delta proteobacterium TaxID=34034 RepID=A0A212J321_9DELT|nr:putative Permease [uncultured delta proteobacterium]